MVHGRQLQLLLRAEGSEQATLAHRKLLRQTADGEAFQPLDRGDVHRRVEDLSPRALAALHPSVHLARQFHGSDK